jgi:aspartokinase-like uncharacterized kinase
MSVCIVKLGGSLYDSAQLPAWLDAIASAGAGKVIVVPGGGPWADAVRSAQRSEGFDERTAHWRALRAMERYASALAGMRRALIPAHSTAAMQAILRHRGIALWMPYAMVAAQPTIPASWDVSADSLAAWLAQHLDAAALLLVKSVRIERPQPDIAELTRRGWVDRAFGRFTSNARFPVTVFGPGDQSAAQAMLSFSLSAVSRRTR